MEQQDNAENVLNKDSDQGGTETLDNLDNARKPAKDGSVAIRTYYHHSQRTNGSEKGDLASDVDLKMPNAAEFADVDAVVFEEETVSPDNAPEMENPFSDNVGSRDVESSLKSVPLPSNYTKDANLQSEFLSDVNDVDAVVDVVDEVMATANEQVTHLAAPDSEPAAQSAEAAATGQIPLFVLHDPDLDADFDTLADADMDGHSSPAGERPVLPAADSAEEPTQQPLPVEPAADRNNTDVAVDGEDVGAENEVTEPGKDARRKMLEALHEETQKITQRVIRPLKPHNVAVKPVSALVEKLRNKHAHRQRVCGSHFRGTPRLTSGPARDLLDMEASMLLDVGEASQSHDAVLEVERPVTRLPPSAKINALPAFKDEDEMMAPGIESFSSSEPPAGMEVDAPLHSPLPKPGGLLARLASPKRKKGETVLSPGGGLKREREILLKALKLRALRQRGELRRAERERLTAARHFDDNEDVEEAGEAQAEADATEAGADTEAKGEDGPIATEDEDWKRKHRLQREQEARRLEELRKEARQRSIRREQEEKEAQVRSSALGLWISGKAKDFSSALQQQGSDATTASTDKKTVETHHRNKPHPNPFMKRPIPQLESQERAEEEALEAAVLEEDLFDESDGEGSIDSDGPAKANTDLWATLDDEVANLGATVSIPTRVRSEEDMRPHVAFPAMPIEDTQMLLDMPDTASGTQGTQATQILPTLSHAKLRQASLERDMSYPLLYDALENESKKPTSLQPAEEAAIEENGEAPFPGNKRKLSLYGETKLDGEVHETDAVQQTEGVAQDTASSPKKVNLRSLVELEAEEDLASDSSDDEIEMPDGTVKKKDRSKRQKALAKMQRKEEERERKELKAIEREELEKYGHLVVDTEHTEGADKFDLKFHARWGDAEDEIMERRIKRAVRGGWRDKLKADDDDDEAAPGLRKQRAEENRRLLGTSRKSMEAWRRKYLGTDLTVAARPATDGAGDPVISELFDFNSEDETEAGRRVRKAIVAEGERKLKEKERHQSARLAAGLQATPSVSATEAHPEQVSGDDGALDEATVSIALALGVEIPAAEATSAQTAASQRTRTLASSFVEDGDASQWELMALLERSSSRGAGMSDNPIAAAPVLATSNSHGSQPHASQPRPESLPRFARGTEDVGTSSQARPGSAGGVMVRSGSFIAARQEEKARRRSVSRQNRRESALRPQMPAPDVHLNLQSHTTTATNNALSSESPVSPQLQSGAMSVAPAAGPPGLHGLTRSNSLARLAGLSSGQSKGNVWQSIGHGGVAKMSHGKAGGMALFTSMNTVETTSDETHSGSAVSSLAPTAKTFAIGGGKGKNLKRSRSMLLAALSSKNK